MAKPLGGRGIKAPYQTTHVRIPVDIKAQVEALSNAYKEGRVIDDSQTLSQAEAIELAHKILKAKKSARVSLKNLLTGIYKTEIDL